MTNGEAQSLEQQVWTALQQGNVKQAIAACERLNREFPDFESGWHTTSQLALRLGNASMALDAVRETSELVAGVKQRIKLFPRVVLSSLVK